MPTATNDVSRALAAAGYSWILQEPDQEQILRKIANEIDEFIEAYCDQFHVTPDPFALLNENPSKGIAFFQSYIGPPHSVEIRMLIWHLLAGAEIVSVNLTYEKNGEFRLAVIAESPYGEPAEFTSGDAWDFRALRHIGLIGMGDGAILDGYYALRRQ